MHREMVPKHRMWWSDRSSSGRPSSQMCTMLERMIMLIDITKIRMPSGCTDPLSAPPNICRPTE